MDRLSILFLAVSRAVAEKYQAGVTLSKVHYLYQPINVNVNSPGISNEKPPDQFTCIMVGKLQQGKRQEDALRAMAELRDQGLQVHLWLVGARDPDYGHFLDIMVGEYNLQAQVKFFGQVDNALPYIQQADVLLLCSRCEAFARVVIEAMKAGKPVIGTNSGGTVEQITEGFNGLLYEPQNYRELAEKIRFLYHRPDKVQEMGGQAQKWARQNFTRERYQEKIKKIFESL
jgi:glycosyltransferase involved in cell wall biosynthesis